MSRLPPNRETLVLTLHFLTFKLKHLCFENLRSAAAELAPRIPALISCPISKFLSVLFDLFSWDQHDLLASRRCNMAAGSVKNLVISYTIYRY